MYSNTTLLNVFHPMHWLPRSNKIYLAEDLDVTVGIQTRGSKIFHGAEDCADGNEGTAAV
jgi:hypothetical protein